MRYPCVKCEYAATTAGDLKRNFESKHEGVRNPCGSCEYASTTSDDLKSHIKSKHEGLRYSCFKCEYAATTAGSLNQHIERKHEGGRYPCDKCEYTATTAGNLKRHMESKHEGVIYPCDRWIVFIFTIFLGSCSNLEFGITITFSWVVFLTAIWLISGPNPLSERTVRNVAKKLNIYIIFNPVLEHGWMWIREISITTMHPMSLIEKKAEGVILASNVNT